MGRSFALLWCLLSSMVLPAQKTYLQCGQLVDVQQGKVLKEKTIVVEANKIVNVVDGYEGVDNGIDRVIDLRNRYVLPGLMDMHVHIETNYDKSYYLNRFTKTDADIAFRSARIADITLMAGFTTVRDLGGSGVNVSLRNAINEGMVRGPRIYTAAKSIAVTGGHADPTNGARPDLMGYPGPEQGVCDGPDECRKAVRQQVKNGADLIKITATGGVLSVARDGYRPQFTEEEARAIVETANDFGIKVAAHAHGAEGMKRAVLAGVSSIEHGTLMTDEVMDLMKQRGTYYVPTITAGKAVADSARVRGFYPSVVVPKALAIGPKIQDTFAKAYKKGVKIAFGTDAGVFAHGKNALEFGYMVEAGMKPMEALQTATTNAADLLGVSNELGIIEKGKLADIIAVGQNPLENIRTMENVLFVMKDGVIYKNN